MSFDPITLALALAKPNVLDLDKYGMGEVLSGLIAAGGGNDNGDLDGDSTVAKTIIKMNPNYVSLNFQDLPVTCTVATKVVFEGEEIQLGFKAFLLMGGEIAEVTVSIQVMAYDYQVPGGEGEEPIPVSRSGYYITVQMGT